MTQRSHSGLTKPFSENLPRILYFVEMKTKDNILDILAKNKESLYSKYPIESLAIFGSVARDESNDESDVDVLVEFSDNIGIRFIDLAEEIESLLNRHVDLVSKNAVKPKYYETIKNEIIYV